MTRNLRHLAVHLALAAMILRALLPTGWMPNLSGQPGSALIICSMDGATSVTGDQGNLPTKHLPDGHGDHDGCPFAAAPHLAAAGSLPAIQQSLVAQSFVSGFAKSQAPPALTGYAPQSPRAPPYFV